MKDSLSKIGLRRRSYVAWVGVLALIIVTLFLVLTGPASDASGDAPAGPGLAEPVAVAADETAGPGPADGIVATAPLSPTKVFLPFVPKGFPVYPNEPFGIQISSPELAYIAHTDNLGARWVRIWLRWGDFEPENTTPENYRRPAEYEAGLRELAKEGIRPIVVVHANPSWAATYRGGVIDKVPIGEFVEFMEEMVRRYSQPPYNIKHWEFYNEPDNGDEYWASQGWGYWGNDPEAYADMLAAVYGPMKAIDPDAQIVFGGLAYDNWTYEGGPFVHDFLDEVLAHGGGDYFDIMNFHYYQVFYWGDYGKGIIGKATALRNTLAVYGVYKPFICTEVSQWTDPENGGSYELQSQYIPKVYARSMAADLKFTIWLKLIDSDRIGAWEYGLLHSNGSIKPGYYAYQTLTEQLAPTEYVRTWSDSETGSEEVEAYEFAELYDPIRIIVAWSNDEFVYEMGVPAGQLIVVDKYGGETTIRDGDDGSVDGVVHVDIGESPVYLRIGQ